MGANDRTRRHGGRARTTTGAIAAVALAAACVVAGPAVTAGAGPARAHEDAGRRPDRPVILFDVPSVAQDVSDRDVIVGWYAPDGGEDRHAFRRSPAGQVRDLGRGEALAVNDAGVVVGAAGLGEAARAVRWEPDGSVVDLGVPASFSVAYDVNAGGTVVGYAFVDGRNRAFVARPGEPAELLPEAGTVPGGFGDLAAGINDRGTAVGFSFDGDGTTKVVTWDSRTGVPSIVPARRPDYDVQDINNRGTIVGTTTADSGGYQAVTWVGRNHREADVPPPGADSLGRDINDHGVVVGFRWVSTQAFAWSPRTGTRLLPGIYGWNEPLAVNNRGTIVGYTNTATGPQLATIFASG